MRQHFHSGQYCNLTETRAEPLARNHYHVQYYYFIIGRMHFYTGYISFHGATYTIPIYRTPTPPQSVLPVPLDSHNLLFLLPFTLNCKHRELAYLILLPTPTYRTALVVIPFPMFLVFLCNRSRLQTGIC